MVVPVVPIPYVVAVFVLLMALLVQKEIGRALGRSEAGMRGLLLNGAIGILLVVYGAILLTRFLNLLWL